MAKYIYVTGGVVSSLGKGITASSIGQLLKSRGLKVFMQKFDPYINIDPGTMNPYQHGEVFVTEDGSETDLDLGHYERFIDVNLNKHSSITTGKIYQSVIKKERKGEYLGSTVQVIPHITNQIKKKLLDVAKYENPDIVIVEIGGTVGDIESLPFIEAIRQTRRELGFSNTFYLHVTLVPFLKAANELKTKPTQHSFKELLSLGVHPDALMLRTEKPIDEHTKEKISLFCDLEREAIFEALDRDVLYQVIVDLYNQKIDDLILNHFGFNKPKADISAWINLVELIRSLKKSVSIGIVGKYVSLPDAYLSIIESLKHAGYFHNRKIEVLLLDASSITDETAKTILSKCDGILVPGGFGERAFNGKLAAIKYARINNIPFFGICYGMQIAIVEYARNVLGILDAHTEEIDPTSSNLVISLQKNQLNESNIGGTLRLGSYDCTLLEGSLAYQSYQTKLIKERHRHRFEFNNDYLKVFNDSKMIFSGINEANNLVEIVELKGHKWFLGTQFHPEFLSRPLRCHPLFRDFIKASISPSK